MKKNQIINARGEVVTLDDDSGIVPDGYGIRVHMMLQDSVQRAIATNTNHRITDAFGNAAGHRPGYVFGRDSNEAEARDAYDAHKAWLTDAWRTPTSVSDQTSQEKRRTLDNTDPETVREDYKTRLQNAWRTTGGVGFGPGSYGG